LYLKLNLQLLFSAVQNYRYLTTLSWALTTVVVSGIVFGKVREEGIFSDDYLWMRYQVRMELHVLVELQVMFCVLLKCFGLTRSIFCAYFVVFAFISNCFYFVSILSQ
jgi:hypothetical protein